MRPSHCARPTHRWTFCGAVTESGAREMADVIAQFGEQLRQSGQIGAWQKKTLTDLGQCRTALLGGHVDACTGCGQLRVSYNSCRNRNCPKCQSLEHEAWILGREADLLHAGTARLDAALAIGERLGKLMLLIRKNHAVPRCCGTDRKGLARTEANGHNQLLETDLADKSRTRFLQKTGKVPVRKQGKPRLKTHSTRPIRAKKSRHYCLGSQVVPASFNKAQPQTGGICE